MRKQPNYWTDEKVHQELLSICGGTGVFPSNTDLVKLGRNDLSNQIARRGGFIHWSKRLGFERVSSDSDTGWHGEDECLKILSDFGFTAEKTGRLRAPYDILVNESVRIDVKTAKFAEYGPCRGWFYRIGKDTSADILMLYQMDAKDSYIIPWSICPSTNITISKSGGKYAKFKNAFDILREMTLARSQEIKHFQSQVVPYANAA